MKGDVPVSGWPWQQPVIIAEPEVSVTYICEGSGGLC